MSRTDPLVSVVMPAYNRARFVGAAVDSVLRQSFSDLELIVVDDGSTDGTADALAAIADPRLRVLRRPHAGIGASLNAGLALARGRYFARLDSDDLWDAAMLATLVPALERHQDLGFVYARGRAIDPQGQPLDHVQGYPPRYPDDPLRTLVYDDCTCNIALLARRAAIDRAGGFDEALVANEDWDIWLRVARQQRFAFVDRVLAYFRWHEDNLTGPRSPQLAAVLESRRVPLDKLGDDPDLPAAVRGLLPLAYTNVHLAAAQRWLQAGDRRRAAGQVGAALRTGHSRADTAVRIVWFLAISPLLRRSAAGRAALERFAAARRRRHVARTRDSAPAADSDRSFVGKGFDV